MQSITVDSRLCSEANPPASPPTPVGPWERGGIFPQRRWAYSPLSPVPPWAPPCLETVVSLPYSHTQGPSQSGPDLTPQTLLTILFPKLQPSSTQHPACPESVPPSSKSGPLHGGLLY